MGLQVPNIFYSILLLYLLRFLRFVNVSTINNFSILTESLNFGVDVSTLVQSSNCFEQNRQIFYSLWAQTFSPCSFAVYLTLYFDNNCPGNRVLKMDKNRTNHHNTNYFPSLFQLQTSQHKANDNIFHLQRIAKSFIFCIIFDSSRKKRMT